MEEKTLKKFKSMGGFLDSLIKDSLVLYNVSEDQQIAVEYIIDRVFRTKKLTGRIFKLKEKIDDSKVKEREAIIKGGPLYNENILYFDPNDFSCYEYEPYMFVQPIIEYRFL